MDVGLVSDVHGNRVALEAVLSAMPDVDALVCAGDVVGYNPWPVDCVETVRERALATVSGNHDRAVASGTAFRFNSMARAGVEHARANLPDRHLEWLAGLPDGRTLFDGRLRVVHGHPEDPDRYTYPGEFDAGLFASLDDDVEVLVMGHTHVQHAERVGTDAGERIAVNPGSVGQPRDGDPRAAYAVLDLEAGTVDLRRVEYDVDAVRRAVVDAGLPERIGTRLAEGR